MSKLKIRKKKPAIVEDIVNYESFKTVRFRVPNQNHRQMQKMYKNIRTDDLSNGDFLAEDGNIYGIVDVDTHDGIKRGEWCFNLSYGYKNNGFRIKGSRLVDIRQFELSMYNLIKKISKHLKRGRVISHKVYLALPVFGMDGKYGMQFNKNSDRYNEHFSYHYTTVNSEETQKLIDQGFTRNDDLIVEFKYWEKFNRFWWSMISQIRYEFYRYLIHYLGLIGGDSRPAQYDSYVNVRINRRDYIINLAKLHDYQIIGGFDDIPSFNFGNLQKEEHERCENR